MKICQLWSNQPLLLCQQVVQAHGIPSPILKCSRPRPGLKKGFSMHYSPAQKCRTGNEGCAFQFIGTFSHKNCRNGRCWSDELIYSRNGIHLWKQLKEAKRRRLDTNLVSKSKLESNIFSFNFHVHNFSFCLFSPSAFWSTKQAVKASEHDCQELCVSSLLTKSFEKP